MNKKLLLPFVFILLLSSLTYAAETISSDGFESNSFCGGLNWADCWSTSAYETIVTDAAEGSYAAKIGADRTISRDISSSTDLSQYSSVNISFYRKTPGFSSIYDDALTMRLYMDGQEVLSKTLMDETGWVQEEFSVNNTATSSMSVEFYFDYVGGTEAYVDSVEISGQAEQQQEVTLSMDNNYVVGDDASITMSSTETDALHKLKLSYPNGTVFCDKNLQSPSVAQTRFTTSCDLPEQPVTDAKAFFYLESDTAVNSTKYLNIVDLDNEPSKLKIDEVYFSEQVLQGGSTEVFAVIDKSSDVNISNIYFHLTYPDGTARKLGMSPTINPNEYRAFITDTYQTGYTDFKITVESDQYHNAYENRYYVAPYNPPQMAVHGTCYEVGDEAKVIAQLSNEGEAINNASCYTSVYQPDNDAYFRYNHMNRISDEGLYVYDFPVPNTVGVYPITVTCDYMVNEIVKNVMNAQYNYGTSTSGGGTALWYDDENYSVFSTEKVGNQEMADVELWFANVTNATDFADLEVFAEWQGYTDIENESMDFYWYNHNNSSWVISPDPLSSDINHETISLPEGSNVSNYINEEWTKVKANGTYPLRYEQIKFFDDDFEDGSLSPWTEVENVGGLNTEISSSNPLNGSYSLLITESWGEGDSEGYVYTSVNRSGYENVTVSYTREVTGAETGEIFGVDLSYDQGTTWRTLEEWNSNIAEERMEFDLLGLTQIYFEDFEENNNGDFVCNEISGGIDCTNTGNSPTINGDHSAGLDIQGGGEGALEVYKDTSGLNNVNISYYRLFDDGESGDDWSVEVTNDGGSTWTALESGSGSTPETYQSYDLGASYTTTDFGLRFRAEIDDGNDDFVFDDVSISGVPNETNDIVQIRFRYEADHDSDEFRFDDVVFKGYNQSRYNIFTDFIQLKVVEPSGIVNEVRGSGELNVKDRLADIENNLTYIKEGVDELNEVQYEIDYIMPPIFSPQDSTHVTVYLHSIKDHSIGYDSANCSLTISGPSNSSGIGPTRMTEVEMNNEGGGFYDFYAMPPPDGWESGIYTLETNCDGGSDGSWYEASGFRMESDIYELLKGMNKTLDEVNITTVAIQNYLQNTIYPEVDNVEEDLSSVLANQTVSYQKLLDLQNNISEVNIKLDVMEGQLENVNSSVISEINQNEAKLDVVEDLSNQILGNISDVLEPKLNQIQGNITTIKSDLQILIDATDSLEEGQQNLSNNLTTIYDQINAVNSSILTELDNVQGGNNTQILAELSYIKNQLDCNVTVAMCAKLDNINDSLQDINSTMSDIETDVLGNRQFLIEINDTTQLTYNYLQNTIYPEIDTVEEQAQDIIANQSTLSSQITAVNTNVSQNYNKLAVLEVFLQGMNASVYQEINENQGDLLVMNNTLTAIKLYQENNLTTDLSEIRDLVIKTNATVSGVQDYLEGTLEPKVDNLETDLGDVLNNQSNLYSELLATRADIGDNYNELQALGLMLGDINVSLTNEINSNEAKLNQLNTTVETLLDRIDNVVTPKLDAIDSNISIMQLKLDGISDDVNSLSNNFSVELGDLNNSINQLDANIADMRNNFTIRFDEVDNSIGNIFTLSQRIDSRLNCSHSVNPVCDKLDSLLNDTGDIGLALADMESYMKINLTNNLTEVYNITLGNQNLSINMSDELDIIRNQTFSISNQLNSSMDIKLTGDNRVLVTEDYAAEITFYNEQGKPIYLGENPKITLFDPDDQKVVDRIGMTYQAPGVYGYNFTLSSSSEPGSWKAVVESEFDNETMYNFDHFTVVSNPTQIQVEVTSVYANQVCADILIENEGTTAYEYIFYWWNTQESLGSYEEGHDKGHASKLIQPGEVYTVNKCLNLITNNETEYFRAKVWYGEYSYAADTYVGTDETPDDDGGGSTDIFEDDELVEAKPGVNETNLTANKTKKPAFSVQPIKTNLDVHNVSLIFGYVLAGIMLIALLWDRGRNKQ